MRSTEVSRPWARETRTHKQWEVVERFLTLPMSPQSPELDEEQLNNVTVAQIAAAGW